MLSLIVGNQTEKVMDSEVEADIVWVYKGHAGFAV